MGFLKVDFIDDEILYAGLTSSISSMNGITYAINQKLLYAGSDTEGSIAGTTDETTIATVTIPANTFSTRCVLMASVGFNSSSASVYTTFRLKLGAAASETTKQTIKIWSAYTYSADFYLCAPMLYIDTAETFSNELTAIVTAQNSNAGATVKATCFHLVVEGV